MRYLKSRILKTIRVIRAHDNFLLEVVVQPCDHLIFHQSTNPRSTIEGIFQRILRVSFSRLISPKCYLYVCVYVWCIIVGRDSARSYQDGEIR